VVGSARHFAIVAGLVASLVAAAPGDCQAGTKTLRRSAQNILFFPLDLVLSPYVATKAVYTNWKASDDTTAVKIAYPIFGVVWAMSVNAGASAIRGLAGLLELVPGIVLVPFKADMSPIYDLPENNQALVDTGSDAFKVKFGVDYVSPSQQ
jgi:hypothetical protein